MKIYPEKKLDLYTLNFLETFNKYTLKHRMGKYKFEMYNPVDFDFDRFSTLFKKSDVYIISKLPMKILDYSELDLVKQVDLQEEFAENHKYRNIFENYKPEFNVDLENINNFRLDEISQVEVKSYDDDEYFRDNLIENEINIYINLDYLNKITDDNQLRCLILITSIYYSYFCQNFPLDKKPYDDKSIFMKLVISQQAIYRTIYLLAEHFYNDNEFRLYSNLENLYIIENIILNQPNHIKWGLNFLKYWKLDTNEPKSHLTTNTINLISTLVSKKYISEDFISEWISANKKLERLYPTKLSPNNLLNSLIEKELE